MGHVRYYDPETVVTVGDYYHGPLTNAERQAEGADVYMRELSKLIAERYPGVLQIHDYFMVEAPAEHIAKVADGVKDRMTDVLRNWHKTAGFGAPFTVDRADCLKNFGFASGDPVNWDDMSG